MNKHNHGYFSALFAGGTFVIMNSSFFAGGKIDFPFFIIVLSIISTYLGYLSFKERCDDKELAIMGILLSIFCFIEAVAALLYP